MVPGRLTHIGKQLQSRLKRFFDSPLDADATPLEICQAVLDEVECKLHPVGRGRRIFPYNRVVVRIRQMNDDRLPLAPAFAGLDHRLRERLEELHCEAPKALDVKIAFVKKAPPAWTAGQLFAVEYHTDTEPAPDRGREPPPPSVHVTVLKGSATRKAYTFIEPVISIGRTPEPTDGLGHVRRNRVAFLETVDGVTETVGRAHARLRFDAKTREYRLFDEGSSNGTAIVRDGTTIPVPRCDPQGVRVRSGDEVHVGRAVIRVELETGGNGSGTSKVLRTVS